MTYCHKTLAKPQPRLCLKGHCTMWSESEEECLEVFILRNKTLEIWREQQ